MGLQMYKVFDTEGKLIGKCGGESALLREGYEILNEVYDDSGMFIGWKVEEYANLCCV